MKCKFCKKDIISKHSKIFCDSSCSAKYNNKNRKYKPSKDKRTKIGHCVTCNKEININIRANLKNCKCKDCGWKARTAKRIINCTCVVCGKHFTHKGYIVKTCSDKCYKQFHKEMAMAHPNCGGTRNTKRSYYKNILMDSSWEVEIAKWLDKHNIIWERSRKLILWWTDEEGKRRRYYPDFYLPKYDVYLDPKNDFRIKEDKFKLQQVVKENNIKLIYGNCDKLINQLITIVIN